MVVGQVYNKLVLLDYEHRLQIYNYEIR